MSEPQQGKLVILSGPSGVGKSTVVSRLLKTCRRPLVLSVSATTRPPRPGEKDGCDYHFLTDEQFARLREEGEMVECFEVFGRGYWYGTLRSELTTSLAAGKWVLLDIDVDGTFAVVKQYPDAITLFLRPPTMEQLEERLRGRGTENEETIRRRLAVAERELSFVDRYQHQIINDSVDRAVREICEILT